MGALLHPAPSSSPMSLDLPQLLNPMYNVAPSKTKAVANTKANNIQKRKRVYKSRRVVPEHKEYVDEYQELDVLCGRGARSNKHPGNQRYLELVEVHKAFYRQAGSEKEKRAIALNVLTTIREQGVRILEQEASTQRWYLAHEKTAYVKVSQALRDTNDEASRAAKRAKYGSGTRR